MMPYPVIDVKAAGENILRRRIERGYTVLDVQRYLNLACPQSVYHWQAGRTLPNIDNFYALSVLLGTTVNDLVAVVTYYGLAWLLLLEVLKIA